MGRIEPRDHLTFRVALGEARLDGKTYWVEQNLDGSPHIVSQSTQKRFTISWDEIIGAAIEAGIDTP